MLKKLFSSSERKRSTSPASPGTLRRLRVFAHLSHDERLLLAGHLEVVHLKTGEALFEIGDEGPKDHLLLEGRLQITGMDESERTLGAGSKAAQNAICTLRPRQYNAVALEDSSCLEIDRQMLVDFIATRPASNDDKEEVPDSSAGEAERLEASFIEDLEHNRFVVTSLPEVASKVRKVLDDPGFTTEQVATAINADPAIAVKLMKACNSPLYRTWESCDSTAEAVLRLGVTTTRQLVMSFALKDLFKADTVALKKAMQQAWRHTVFHSAIAWVMASESGAFKPEEAMTAAMLSNLGILSVCAYLENHPDVCKEPEAIAEAIALLKARVGARIMEKWGLSQPLVECAQHSDDWQRELEGPADLCDLVIVAALHAYIGRRKVPKFDEVLSFQRLCAAGHLDPEKALDFLETASEQVAEARSLLEL